VSQHWQPRQQEASRADDVSVRLQRADDVNPRWDDNEVIIDTGGQRRLITPRNETLWKALVIRSDGLTKWILKKLLDNRFTRP
jgi:hypothetical protein